MRFGNNLAFSDKPVKNYTIYYKKTPTAPCVVGVFMIKYYECKNTHAG